MTKEEILAMEAGQQELDALIIGLCYPELSAKERIDDFGKLIISWHPSTDIRGAWQVVDKMFELGYAMSLLHLSSGFYPEYWYCDFRAKDSNKPPEYEWVDHQKTAPEAICKAALLAKLEGGNRGNKAR